MTTDLIARGLAAKTAATVRANTITVEEFGALPTGNSRAAVQRAIDLAAANGIPKVTTRLPRMELWDKPNATGGFSPASTFFAERLLVIPGCDSLDLDFAGAQITLKGPTGGVRFPGQLITDIGLGNRYVGGFLAVKSPIKHLRIANVDVEGGFTGDTLNQDNVNLYDKGFLYQDLGENNLGVGVGAGTTIMDNVVLHGFSGEIMYDNSSKLHISRDCHFYNSGHSCWNPSGLGKVVAYNLQAGISRQPAEVLAGKGHTYYGGRFYKAGNAGSTFIGGPDPTFDGVSYNNPVRRTDAPPPYVTFHGTRFEEFASFLYLGSYMRGSIITTDVALFLATGFASNSELKDIDLDIYATCDRAGNFNAVTLAGQASNTGAQPKNINLRIHCARTELATDNGVSMTALGVSGFIDAGNCAATIDGTAATAFTASFVAGSVLPLIDTSGFREGGNVHFLYFAADQTYTIGSRAVTLYPTAAGTFNFTLNTAPGYTEDQLFTFRHDGSGSADRIVSFAKNAAGMTLSADRTLRRAGEYLTLRRSGSGATWVEHAYMGQGA